MAAAAYRYRRVEAPNTSDACPGLYARWNIVANEIVSFHIRKNGSWGKPLPVPRGDIAAAITYWHAWHGTDPKERPSDSTTTVNELWESVRKYRLTPRATKPLDERTANDYSILYDRWIREALGSLQAASVDGGNIIALADRMKAQGASDSQLEHVYTVVSMIFTWGMKERFNRIVRVHPVKAQKDEFFPIRDEDDDEDERPLPDSILSEEEETQAANFIANPPPVIRKSRSGNDRSYDRKGNPIRADLIRFMPMCGGRISEMCAIRVDGVDIPGRRIRIAKQTGWKGKGLKRLKGNGKRPYSKPRWVRLTPEAVAWLETYLAWLQTTPLYREDGYLFPSERGTPINPSNIRRDFYEALDEIGVDRKGRKIRLHSLRHTYASRMWDRGFSLRMIAANLGDSERTTESTYIHIFKGGVSDEAFDRIAEATRTR